MKVFVISLLSALVSGAAASVVAWPGASAPVALSSPYLKTILPPQTKAFGYSTTQYIHSLPASYSVQYHPQPQYALQIPQLSSFAHPQPAYYPIAGPGYFPSSSFFFPSNPIASLVPGLTPIGPAAPGAPISPSIPAGPPSTPPEQEAGDADTAVIDSADISQDQQQLPATETPIQSQPSESPPTNTFPNFPSFPQGSEGPSFPQIPQGLPSFPQGSEGPSFPQIPQFPQGSAPGFPQFPQFPSNPPFPQGPSPSPPSSFPGGPTGDKGLNDEDTISVESA